MKRRAHMFEVAPRQEFARLLCILTVLGEHNADGLLARYRISVRTSLAKNLLL
ncbi:hypothetical protein [Candidatus Poriferisodalis sp.]|uniref:hypothetical protein n=1 Tax=Candidatus Poriferisodalis sp. TaxID=3101277 RepID=UPI003D0B02D0